MGTTQASAAGEVAPHQGRFSPLSLGVLVASVTGVALVVPACLQEGSLPPLLTNIPANQFTAVAAAVLVGLLSVAILVSRTLGGFRLLALAKLALLCLVISSVKLGPLGALLVVPYLVELAAYEMVLTNLVWSLVALGALGVASGAPLERLWQQHPWEVVLYPAVAGLATMVFYFRENFLNMVERNREIEDALKRLTKANLGYLNYSSQVSETSKVEERNRITRELHDIVGYTFVTNLMMLEAVKDLVLTDQKAGLALLGQTRENLEQGLKDIREALYQWRLRPTETPADLNRVFKMLKIIEEATKIRVHWNAAEGPEQLDADVGRFLFNFLQETIVNSFLHGHATEVTVTIGRPGGSLVCAVTDNGQGAASLTEGIGIQGIRERLGQLGGVLQLRSHPYGFEVTAEIPDKYQVDRMEGDLGQD